MDLQVNNDDFITLKIKGIITKYDLLKTILKH